MFTNKPYCRCSGTKKLIHLTHADPRHDHDAQGQKLLDRSKAKEKDHLTKRVTRLLAHSHYIMSFSHICYLLQTTEPT